ncbi:Xylose isomerase [Frankliniella fusca]|uniref:Xylose isomerase n=1 Tax=Frankliniella fusca TaxID=407009 RepID=A0AAE1LPA2_9NEOP|nr:Xylose isomerase [Frankliniella fusca]
MATHSASIAILLALCIVGPFSIAAALDAGASAGDTQCADPTAKSVMATLGGRSRIMTVLMNFVKCLQRASSDVYKMVTDLLAELAGCISKADVFETAKCLMSESPIKKLSAFVVRIMDVVKCALE